MKDNYLQALEAILFASSEPVSIEKIAQVFKITSNEAMNLCENLREKLDKNTSGLKLVKIKESYQMCSKGEYKGYIQEIMNLKKNTVLSSAAMEVLAIIAYNEPVTRAFIDQVRGVDCSYIINSLCQKGLVEERGRLSLPGRPLLYGVTNNFLRCFGLENLQQLPKVNKEETDINN